jgi:hypothetical protein
MNQEWTFTPKEQEILDRCLPHLDEDQKEMFYEEAWEHGSQLPLAEDAYEEALPVLIAAIERNLRERLQAKKTASAQRTNQ